MATQARTQSNNLYDEDLDEVEALGPAGPDLAMAAGPGAAVGSPAAAPLTPC
jgi:hypothetical protein